MAADKRRDIMPDIQFQKGDSEDVRLEKYRRLSQTVADIAHRPDNFRADRLVGYVVAGLPIGAAGDTAYALDALSPVFGAAVVGGGAVVIPIFHDGTRWIVG